MSANAREPGDVDPSRFGTFEMFKTSRSVFQVLVLVLLWFCSPPPPPPVSGSWLLGRRRGDGDVDGADRPNVAPDEFKRQENKQAFWSQRAHSLSLTLRLTLFLSLPLSPSPLYLSSAVPLSSPLLTSSFFIPSSPHLQNSPRVFQPDFFPPSYLHAPEPCPAAVRVRQKQQGDRHHLTSRGADRQTDQQTESQTRASLFPYVQSWCSAQQHNMENVSITSSLEANRSRGLRERPLQPVGHPLAPCAVTSRPVLTPCVFLCIQMGWCEKASPITALLSTASAAHSWVWLRYHLPPQACFPFSKHARFCSDRKHLAVKKTNN